MGSLGIYVHVPFCVKKCNYCDFLSFPLKRETDCSEVENYVNALQKEICNPFKMPESPAEVDTIYLGGGTPSLLSGRQIGTILDQRFTAIILLTFRCIRTSKSTSSIHGSFVLEFAILLLLYTQMGMVVPSLKSLSTL